MKASELITNLQLLIESHGDLDLIYASDDEGNGYDMVHFPPSLYTFLGRDEVITKESALENDREFIPNAICIN